MKVSIVIPAHNEGSRIQTTLQAVRGLEYSDYEIIVVDNASTDSTFKLALEFKHVKVIQESRKGTQYAREAGRKIATGMYIANIDADCLPEKDWLTKAVTHLNQKNAVAITGPYDYYDGSRFLKITTYFAQHVVYPIIHHVCQLLGIGAIMIAGNCVMRARALEAIGGYNTSINFYGDDTDTAKRLQKIGNVIFDRKLVMKSSARRYTNIGMLKTTYLYIMNFFFVLIFNKPYNQHTS